MLRLGNLAAGALAATVVFTGSASAQDYSWRIQSLFPSGDPLYVHFAGCVDDIQTASGGRLKIDVLPSGAAVGAGGTLDAIRAGVLDGHYSYAPIWTGLEPAFAILGDLPASHSTSGTLIDFYYNEDGLALMQEAYGRFNGHTIGIVVAGVESLASRKPVGMVADLSGLKVRVPAGMASDLFTRLGAAPVSLPLSEAFGALEKGVVDAADIGSLSYNQAIGVYQFAKHTLYPSFHSNVVLDFTVNEKRWDELPDDLKRLLSVSMQACAARYAGQSMRADLKAIEDAQESGLTVYTYSAEDEARLREAAREVWNEWAGKGDLAKKALDAQVAYLRQAGILTD